MPRGQGSATPAGAGQRALQAARNLGQRTELVAGARPGDVRYLDVGLAAAAAVGSALWTATRPSLGAQVGWGTFQTLLGAIAAAEGRGPLLRYGGFGLLGANAAYLLLRATRPDLRPNPEHTKHARAGSGYMF